MNTLHPSGFLCQDLTAPVLWDGASPFPPHYHGLYHYLDDPFCGKRADRDPACRALHDRTFSREVEDGLYILTPLLTDPALIRDYREACFALDIPTRWLFLHTDAPTLRCDIHPLPPMTLLGYEVFCTDVVDETIMLDLFCVTDLAPASVGQILAAYRARLNENSLFATAEDCRAYLHEYIRLAEANLIGDMEGGEAEDYCVAAVYEVRFPPLET